MAKVSSAATVKDIMLDNVTESDLADLSKTKKLESSIPIQLYQSYFDALLSDNADVVENTLKSCVDPDELNVLLNCPFDFDEGNYCIGKFGKQKYRVTLPFHLAVGSASKSVAQVLINYSVNTQTNDNGSHNVLHSLSTMATYYPQLEGKVCSMFQWLLSQTGKNNIVELLEGENDDGLRPLEYAAQQGTLQLVRTIFETKGIYVAREDIRGMMVYRWHDITEYECGNRKDKSPLRYIAYLQKEKLTDKCTCDIILGPLFTAWIAAKIKQNWLPAVFWLLIRLSYMTAFFIFDVDVSYMEKLHPTNLSDYTCSELELILSKQLRYSITIILVIASVGLLLFDIIDFIRCKCRGCDKVTRYLLGYKQLIINTTFYRVCQSVMYISVLICVPLLLTRSGNGGSISLIIDITKVAIPIMCVWSIMYFIQLLPVVGSSIISIQGMIKDMAHFITLYLVMILPFIHVFETFVQHNSNEGCIDDFSSVFKTGYTIFRIMLNMVDLTAFQITHIGILYSLHIIFIFLVAIMLINFLVAVMATSASNIAEHQKLILTLNRLALVTTLEDRLAWCFAWYYKWLGRKLYNCTKGRVYVVSQRNRGDQLLSQQPEQCI